MTAVYITAIIAAALVINSIVIAMRDVAKAKHQPTREHRGDDNSKENEA
ncbi:hypothetical protein [Streptomyces stelliscabiei]|nr:hypothetical protein [Streptomyces stelliscabiei]MDX2550097.1 hypothetical protein [Streptomyces stelliscabiei]